MLPRPVFSYCCKGRDVPYGDWSLKACHAVQAHPALRLAAKVLLGALAVTAVYQSQLYALWLQWIVAGVAAVLVAACGFSRSSLSSSGKQSLCSSAVGSCSEYSLYLQHAIMRLDIMPSSHATMRIMPYTYLAHHRLQSMYDRSHYCCCNDSHLHSYLHYV